MTLHCWYVGLCMYLGHVQYSVICNSCTRYLVCVLLIAMYLFVWKYWYCLPLKRRTAQAVLSFVFFSCLSSSRPCSSASVHEAKRRFFGFIAPLPCLWSFCGAAAGGGGGGNSGNTAGVIGVCCCSASASKTLSCFISSSSLKSTIVIKIVIPHKRQVKVRHVFFVNIHLCDVWTNKSTIDFVHSD